MKNKKLTDANAREGKSDAEYANELGLNLQRGSMGEFLSDANVSMGRAMVRGEEMEKENAPRSRS